MISYFNNFCLHFVQIKSPFNGQTDQVDVSDERESEMFESDRNLECDGLQPPQLDRKTLSEHRRTSVGQRTREQEKCQRIFKKS